MVKIPHEIPVFLLTKSAWLMVKTKIAIKHGDLVKTQLLMMNHPFCWFNLHIYWYLLVM